MKLELRGITKRFGSLVANDSIDLVVEPGEIHALLGENGAGKSTLMNVLYGLYQPDEGEILVDDEPVTFNGPGDAMAAGIGMVHQHFMLIPVFTVAENVMLGHEDARAARLPRPPPGPARRRGDLEPSTTSTCRPTRSVADLPVGVQQRVEIIKALSRNAKMLILDEPTAVLTPQETDELITVMRALRDGGTSIVFITHKLREVRAVADRITVIRRGKVVGTAEPTALGQRAGLDDGRPAGRAHRRQGPGEARRTCARGRRASRSSTTTAWCSSTTCPSPCAAARSTRWPACRATGRPSSPRRWSGCGRSPPAASRIDGQSATELGIDDVLELGVGYVPEDRLHDGLIGSFTVAENLVLDLYDTPPFASGPALEAGRDRAQRRRRASRSSTCARSSTAATASTLSGGNQQKVVLAREMSRPLRAADRRPADPRPGRRLDGVRAPAHRAPSATAAPPSC